MKSKVTIFAVVVSFLGFSGICEYAMAANYQDGFCRIIKQKGSYFLFLNETEISSNSKGMEHSLEEVKLLKNAGLCSSLPGDCRTIDGKDSKRFKDQNPLTVFTVNGLELFFIRENSVIKYTTEEVISNLRKTEICK